MNAVGPRDLANSLGYTVVEIDAPTDVDRAGDHQHQQRDDQREFDQSLPASSCTKTSGNVRTKIEEPVHDGLTRTSAVFVLEPELFETVSVIVKPGFVFDEP
jgi:hypothetical protein